MCVFVFFASVCYCNGSLGFCDERFFVLFYYFLKVSFCHEKRYIVTSNIVSYKKKDAHLSYFVIKTLNLVKLRIFMLFYVILFLFVQFPEM